MNSLQAVLDDCSINISHFERVHGGDINEAYLLYSTNRKYFLKVNQSSKYPGMFEKESVGLNALWTNGNLFVPHVIKNGIVQDQQYLLLEWIETGKPTADFWEAFGAGMALLHKQPQSNFGWEHDNYIGSLPQKNTKHKLWDLFYTECRIMPLVMQLGDTGVFDRNDISAAELFCKSAQQLFPGESPALLHGDLWSGNFMINQKGSAAIFDPAVYYGHREMDIGMTKLFGGFDERFYHAYNEVYPLEQNWKQRLPLTQLYPVLVHALLFGGHYVQNARAIIKNF